MSKRAVNVLSSILIIGIMMLTMQFFFSEVNAEDKNNSMEINTSTVNVVSATVDLGKNYKNFYPSSYLKLTKSNKLEKTNAKASKITKLTGKIKIKCYINYKFKYGTGTVYLAEYNGELGYINANVLNNQTVTKSTEPIKKVKADFSKLGRYYFYSTMYVRIKAGTQLMGITSHSSEKTLLQNEQTISVFTNKVYQKGNAKFYIAIYNGNVGYVNVNIVKKVEANIEKNNTKTNNTTKNNITTNNTTKNNTTKNNTTANNTTKNNTTANNTTKNNTTKNYITTNNTTKNNTITNNTITNNTTNNNENSKNMQTIKVDFSKATGIHYFYPDNYLTVKSRTNMLTHVLNSKASTVQLKGIKTIKFYVDTTYTLTTKNGSYTMYKVEMDGKTGFINAKIFTNKNLHIK